MIYVYVENGVVVAVGHAPDHQSVKVAGPAGSTEYTFPDNSVTVEQGYSCAVTNGVPSFAPAKPAFPTVLPVDFALLFETAEFTAIEISSDVNIQTFYRLYQAALQTNTPIYLGTPRVQTGLAYMSANPAASPILAAGRAAAISVGTPATS